MSYGFCLMSDISFRMDVEVFSCCVTLVIVIAVVIILLYFIVMAKNSRKFEVCDAKKLGECSEKWHKFSAS